MGVRQREAGEIQDLTMDKNECIILSMEESMRLHAEWLTDVHGAMWPEPFVEWAGKRNIKLAEVKHDER